VFFYSSPALHLFRLLAAKRLCVYTLPNIVKGEEWVKSIEYLFTYVMRCASVVYTEKVKSEELIAIFLPTMLLLK
jgi:hypothetical protein